MTEIKAKYDIHPSWPAQPPQVVDHLPPAEEGMKPKKKLCPRYFHKCWKTECNDNLKCED
jgi:hypothetical protein